jgi:Tfp pilus assembly protein PilF
MTRSLDVQKQNPICLNNLGIVYKALGKLEDAKNFFKLAIQQNESLADAYNNLAAIYQEQGLLKDAEIVYKKALQLNPENVLTYTNLGTVYLIQDKYQQARESNETALQLNPDFAIAHNNLGAIFQAEGQFEKAKDCYTQALQLDPLLIDAYDGLAAMKAYPAGECEFVRQVEFLLKKENLNIDDKARLYFIMGKIKDENKFYDEAFYYYREGNKLKRELIKYQSGVNESNISRIIKFFTPDILIINKEFGMQSKLPVFIIGMPRSGTTLVEQIIASHPQAAGAGELDFFTKLQVLYRSVCIPI